MTTRYRPDGYSALSPYLICPHAERVLDFAERAFGGVRQRVYRADDGSILHAEVKIEDTVVMIGDAGEQWPAVPSHVHLYVPDVRATYRRCLELGATSAREPQQRPGDSDLRGGVIDAGGNTWWIATEL